ncbi:hypothetical protein ABEG18_19260 [Alsobacter sp. KACC 23698]|uniref:Uncharacterized protein n=1 Tax=Alsobacter sp. KACC 23698 TaxID=3149229 RepID=A0AAU7JC46_9HYPH
MTKQRLALLCPRVRDAVAASHWTPSIRDVAGVPKQNAGPEWKLPQTAATPPTSLTLN